MIERATLTQQSYAMLKRHILDGDLQPGERLNEKQLAIRMGVSPTPVREALNKLAADGLVTYSARQGATVVALTALDVVHLYDIRCSLECLTVREAAPSIIAGGVSVLETMLERAPALVSIGDAASLHELNEAFHGFFRERSGNRWLNGMLVELNDLLILARRPLEQYRSGREAWSEHRAIVAALRDGNGARAEAAMAAHINRVKAELLAQLERTERP